MCNKTDEDICEVNNIPKRYCAHCKTLGNPINKNEINGYSIKESTYLGNPLIEILYKGGPINDFDKNFTFGLMKAKMFIYCSAEIEEFAFLPIQKLKRKYKREKKIGNSIIIIEYFPNFTTSYGKTLNKPYINISYSDVHIGIGQKKAEAVYYLKEKIQEWIDEHKQMSVNALVTSIKKLDKKTIQFNFQQVNTKTPEVQLRRANK